MKNKTKPKTNIKTKYELIDGLAFISSLIYFQSVLTVAHHTSMWPNDGISRVVGPPAVPALVIGLFLCGMSLYRRKSSSTIFVVITLTILATSSLFWLSGLRTNFYF